MVCFSDAGKCHEMIARSYRTATELCSDHLLQGGTQYSQMLGDVGHRFLWAGFTAQLVSSAVVL